MTDTRLAFPLAPRILPGITDRSARSDGPADWHRAAELQVQRSARESRERCDADSAPVSDAVEAGARSLLAALALANPPAPYIYPTRRGTIQLEWERQGRYLEIEVVGERAAEWYFQDELARTESSGAVFEEENLGPLVNLIFQVAGAR